MNTITPRNQYLNKRLNQHLMVLKQHIFHVHYVVVLLSAEDVVVPDKYILLANGKIAQHVAGLELAVPAKVLVYKKLLLVGS